MKNRDAMYTLVWAGPTNQTERMQRTIATEINPTKNRQRFQTPKSKAIARITPALPSSRLPSSRNTATNTSVSRIESWPNTKAYPTGRKPAISATGNEAYMLRNVENHGCNNAKQMHKRAQFNAKKTA